MRIRSGVYYCNSFNEKLRKEKLFFVSGTYSDGGKSKVMYHPLFLSTSQLWYFSSCFVEKETEVSNFCREIRSGVPQFELLKPFDADYFNHFMPRTRVRWNKDLNVYEVTKVFVPSSHLLVSVTNIKTGSGTSIEPEVLIRDYDCVRR